ncbi:SDR family oxidoreductase [Aquimarina addita]|uniref:SDR family oxidoreductase n=1 Tax=Aquimarina addita TaxID=870485 RepID=A0ABP6UKV8_9FLAO
MGNFTKKYGFTEKEWNACLKVLSSLKKDPFHNPNNTHIASLITKIYKQAKKSNRIKSYQQKKEKDLKTVNNSEISKKALRNTTSFNQEQQKHQNFLPLAIPKNCYCCNQSFDIAHSFYNRLCPSCAKINYANRFRSIDLSNRNVILTGGRVKIGYATALKFLRSNANVIITTRFPSIALNQFKKESDYEQWKSNLTVYGLDLRKLKEVQAFITYYRLNYDTLDILVNNAAQTIKYDEAYYLPLIQNEKKLLISYTDHKNIIKNKTPVTETIKSLTYIEDKENLEINRFGQPVDKREKNSWNSTLEEVDMIELLEVNLINQISPYYLIKELTPLLKDSSFDKKFILNVTSSEGQFSYLNKSIFHPHTNMTKASLNMLTRTSAEAYKKHHIYMNSVDVGWVSTGAREELRKRQFSNGYIPPLDPVDGASRILIPIIEGIENCNLQVGKLLKNYKVENW